MKKGSISKHLVLILIVLGLLVNSLAIGQAKDVENQLSNAKYINLVNKIGLLENIENTKGNVKRGDFLILCANLTNSTVTENAKIIFEDVSETSKYNSYAYYAYLNKWISLNNERKFFPESEITLAQAVKILVTITGFNDQAMVMGGYPTGYFAVASSNNMLKGINAKLEATLTYDDIAKILINLFDAPFAEITSIKSEENIYQYGTHTIYSFYHELYKSKGVVSATKFAKLHVNSPQLAKNQVQINDEIYIVDIECASKLGKNVDYYYYNHKEEQYPKILDILERDGNFERQLKANQVKNINADYELIYEDDSFQQKEISLSATTNVIYNNYYVGKLINFPVDKVVNANEGIRLLDNNKDNKFDYIFIDNYDIYVVNNVSADNYFFDSMYNNVTPISLKGMHSDDMPLITKDNKEITFTNIKQYNVACVKKSYDNANIVSIAVTSNEARGKLSEIKSNDNGEEVLVIDGAEYIVNKLYKAQPTYSVSIDNEYNFILDKDDKIVGRKKLATEKAFGYIIDLKAIKKPASNKLVIKMMNYEGEIATYQTTDKFFVDSVMRRLDKESDIDQVISEISQTGTATDYMGGIYEEERGSLTTNIQLKRGIHQLISFKMNDAGYITSIDTVADDKNNDLTRDVKVVFNTSTTAPTSTSRFISASSMFCDVSSNQRAIIGPETFIIMVPVNGKNDENSYMLTSKAKITSSAYYINHAYNVDPETMVAQAIVIEDGNALNSGKPSSGSSGPRKDVINIATDGLKYSIVTNVTKALDATGTETYKVYIMKNKKEDFFYVNDETFTYSHKEYWNEANRDPQNLTPIPPTGLKSGQVLTYTETSATKYAKIIAIVNEAPKITPILADTFIINPSAYEESVFGQLISKKNSTIKVDTNFKNQLTTFAFNAVSSPQVYKCNPKTGRVEAFDFNQITPSQNRYVYMRSRMGKVIIIVIYDY